MDTSVNSSSNSSRCSSSRSSSSNSSDKSLDLSEPAASGAGSGASRSQGMCVPDLSTYAYDLAGIDIPGIDWIFIQLNLDHASLHAHSCF